MNRIGFKEIMVEIHPFDACIKNSDEVRTVSVDTSDLDICLVQRNGYLLRKTVAVDTSDLEAHYEFYRYEQRFKFSKTVSTDTHDLESRYKPRLIVSTGVDTDGLAASSLPGTFCNVCNTSKSCSMGLKNQRGLGDHFKTDAGIIQNGIKTPVNEFQVNVEMPLQDIVKNSEGSPYNPVNDNLGLVFASRINKTRIKELKETRPLLLRKDMQNNANFQMSGKSVIHGNIERNCDSEVSDCDNRDDVHLYECEQDGGPVLNCVNIKDEMFHKSDSKIGVQVGEKPGGKDCARKFECNVCKATFTRKRSIVAHLRMHSADKTFSCDDCGKTFAALKELRNHVQIHVNGNNLFCCILCGKGLNSNMELELHKKTHSDKCSFICTKCCQEVEMECVSKVHSCEKKQQMKHCDLCGKSFQSDTSLHNHLQVFHEMGRTQSSLSEVKSLFECLTCGKRFRSRSALKCHETVHTGERNYVCATCNKAFSTKASLKAHSATHSGLKPFACVTCGKAFAKNDSLKTHHRKHTGERPFICDICGQSFDRNFTLKNHRVTHTGERTNICSVCGKAFATRGALSTHERTRHDSNPDKPRKPYRRRVTDFESCVCDVCGKVYSNQANLRIHKMTHSGDKPFLCTVCGQTFAKKYTLQCHTRKHTDERPFSCDICGLTFFRNHTLKTHKLRHTGERPHACTLCGQRFIQSASLAYHVRHHDRPPRTKGIKRKEKLFGILSYDQPSQCNSKIQPAFSR